LENSGVEQMIKRFAHTLAAAGAVALLVSCGGGGDIAGDSTEFSVTPEEFNLTLTAGTSCSAASTLKPVIVTIVGGQGPFRIVNSSPEALSIDKTQATGKDPQFRVSYRSDSRLCSDPATVTVLDYHSRVATFEYSVEVEDAE
jgi:hypothetical protein